MGLKDEMSTSGKWLFQRRSYLPLLLLFLFVLSLRDYSYLYGNHRWDQIWEIFCLGISLVGLGIRIITIGYAPDGTSSRSTVQPRASSLNTSGMYSIVRNPLYLGNFIIWLCISMFLRMWWFTLIIALVFWVYYERIIFAEEEFLEQKFGNAFMEWAKRTPAFIPKLRVWTKPELSFSFKHAVKREYAGFFAIITTFFILDFLSDYSINRELHFDLMWSVLFCFALVIYLTIRILVKCTTIFNVEGR
jgi:protein-S-isoprenylcysteine O-methyltransferase Ste14